MKRAISSIPCGSLTLETVTMGTSNRDRVRAYRMRQREQGKIRLSVALDAEAHAALVALRAQHPGQTIDRLISDLLTGKTPLPGNAKPLPRNRPQREKPLPRNGRLLPGNNLQPLLGNDPADRAALAEIGRQWRLEGANLEEIAERFNANGWTPNRIPKREGSRPRSDSSPLWTLKAISQLLTRDHPPR